MNRIIFAIVMLLDVWPALAQQEQVERYVREHQAAIVQEFAATVTVLGAAASAQTPEPPAYPGGCETPA